jgi:hypothetical protein
MQYLGLPGLGAAAVLLLHVANSVRYQIVPAVERAAVASSGGMSGHAPRSSSFGTPRTASESCAVGCRRTKALLFRAAALEGRRCTAARGRPIWRELRVGAEYPYRP